MSRKFPPYTVSYKVGDIVRIAFASVQQPFKAVTGVARVEAAGVLGNDQLYEVTGLVGLNVGTLWTTHESLMTPLSKEELVNITGKVMAQ